MSEAVLAAVQALGVHPSREQATPQILKQGAAVSTIGVQGTKRCAGERRYGPAQCSDSRKGRRPFVAQRSQVPASNAFS